MDRSLFIPAASLLALLIFSTPGVGAAAADVGSSGSPRPADNEVPIQTVEATGTSKIQIDTAKGRYFHIVLSPSCPCSIENPINAADGRRILLEINQDAMGGRHVSWGSDFDFGEGGSPSLSQGGMDTDLVGFVYSARKQKWLAFNGSKRF